MIPILSSQHRKIFLTVLVLVIVSVTALIAQYNPPSKETAPAESGKDVNEVHEQDSKFQTFNGEEYVVYQKDGQTVFYDPATGKEFSKLVTTKLWEISYKGNLGELTYVSGDKEIKPDASNSFGYGLHISNRRAENGNVITYTLGGNTIVSVPGFLDIVLEGEQKVDSHGEYTLETIPYGWIDRTHLLVAKGNVPSPYSGIFSLDIATGTEKEIFPGWYSRDGNFLKQEYVEEPYLSPSGRYLIYQKPVGIWSQHDGGKTEPYLYDIQTGTKTKIMYEGYPLWLTTKEISQGPGEPGFFNSPLACDPPIYCGQGGLTFKLPFKCGEAYRVTRDGENCTPAQCGYGDGGYPIANWDQGSGTAHTGKKALDFSDNYLGGTGNDDLPVLAAQTGTVTHKGYDSDFGYNVWILHSDGTYTFYCHLKGQSSWAVGATILQGQTIGIEGCTGTGCTGQHIHFARSIVMNGGNNIQTGLPNSRWMQFDELGPNQIPTDEHVYISKNGPCSGNCCVMPCINGGTLPACGGTFTGQSTSGSNTRATYFVTPTTGSGNLATTNLIGPEKIYQITTTNTTTIKVVLTNVSGGNLKPIIIQSPGSCSNINPLLHCKGNVDGFTATYTNAPPGTYFIIVDGTGAGSYTLNVAACANLTDYGSSRTPNGTRVININARVVNWGTLNAGPFYTKFLLSSDTYWGNDYSLVNLTYSGLSAGYSSTHNFNWTIPNSIPPGWYYLMEGIDYGGAINEVTEYDNNFYFGGSFYVPPAFAGDELNYRSDVVATIDVPNTQIEFDVQTDLNNVIQIDEEQSSVTALPQVCTATVSGYEISATNVAENATYTVANPSGQVICSGKATNGSIQCEVKATGIYFLSIIYATGEKCTQKIFVNQ